MFTAYSELKACNCICIYTRRRVTFIHTGFICIALMNKIINSNRFYVSCALVKGLVSVKSFEVYNHKASNNETINNSRFNGHNHCDIEKYIYCHLNYTATLCYSAWS